MAAAVDMEAAISGVFYASQESGILALLHLMTTLDRLLLIAHAGMSVLLL